MSLDKLYPKPLLRLAAEAHGAGRLSRADRSATRVNPLCGDKITFDLQLLNEIVTALGHDTKACVLCQASASVISQIAIGKITSDISVLRDQLKAALEGRGTMPSSYEAFAAVSAHKSRHNCVLLPLDTLIEGLMQRT